MINEDNSNCAENYPELKCLKDFYKKNRLSKYIYNGNESEIIKLSYEYDKKIRDWENDCLENKCKKDDCKLIHLESIKDGVESTTTIFKSTSLITRFDFYIQFTGLICLIGNICFHQLLSILFEYIKPTKLCIHR